MMPPLLIPVASMLGQVIDCSRDQADIVDAVARGATVPCAGHCVGVGTFGLFHAAEATVQHDGQQTVGLIHPIPPRGRPTSSEYTLGALGKSSTPSASTPISTASRAKMTA